MIRVFVVARSPVVRAGLEALLRPRHTIVGSAAALEAPPEADVLLAELEADTEDAALPMPAVWLLDGSQAPLALESFRQQPRALLPRDAGEAEIAAAVDAVAAGLTVVHPEFLDLLAPTRALGAGAASQALTPREVEVLRMLAEGLPNKTIAWKLGLSEHTVKFHVASIFAKLGVGSRTEAVTAGLRQGLILL